MPQRTCSHPQCELRHYARGVCKRHYRLLPDQALKGQQYQAQPSVRERRRGTDRKRQRGPYQRAWREARRDWGAWWEQQRNAEDRADLAAWSLRQAKRQRRIKRATRPLAPPRQFIAGACSDCAGPFVVVRGWWHGSTRCSRCTQRHWNCGDHLQRARKFGVAYEPIDPVAIFERDRWRCQICGKRTTKGKYPDPRSASLDHIVPMARGGPHLESNVQCACWACNCRKGAGSANDQLRLAVLTG